MGNERRNFQFFPPADLPNRASDIFRCRKQISFRSQIIRYVRARLLCKMNKKRIFSRKKGYCMGKSKASFFSLNNKDERLENCVLIRV